MPSIIDTLIDKQDNFEIVRDALAQILADEIANQMVLATAASKDPTLWDITVFTERFNPWELLRNNPAAPPIANIWYDRSAFSKSGSTVMDKVNTTGTFNIDIIARGDSGDDGAGHTPGDEDAATNAQRAVRLARNIFMSAQHLHLGLRGLVSDRWITSIETFQPSDQSESPKLIGMRINLTARFDEFSPQFTPEILEEIGVTIKRGLDGRVLAKMEFPE